MARRYYVVVNGRKHYASRAAIEAGVQGLANRLGSAVQIGYDETRPGRKKAAAFRRNPMMQGVNFTGELWKVSASGPHGQTGASYANSKGEAESAARLARARGFRVTQIVRLQGPDAPGKKARRR